jgi:hypothetical protein
MRLRHTIVLAAACGLLFLVPGTAAAKSCSPPKYPGDGYFTSLAVTGVSCATGRDVARAYYRCRIRKGIRGRCTTRVLRFSCTERRESISTQFEAKVTCRRGSRRVVHTYQQNT